MSPSEGISISIQNVSKSFGHISVLSPISLTFDSGELCAFLGPSGCGKSTLLRIIAGLDREYSGHMMVGGQESKKNEVGFVFQDAHLLPWRTVLENVRLPLELERSGRDQDQKRVLRILDEVGLVDAAHLYPNQLSGGMKMRASLARALVKEPRLLLLDEPLSALDELTRYRLGELLRALWQRRRVTVLFVTHSISEAVYLANRVVVLSQSPAKIILDHRSPLPDHRRPDLRMELSFAQEVQKLRKTLEGGMGT